MSLFVFAKNIIPYPQLTDLINQFLMEVRALFLALIKGAFAAMQEKKYQSDKKQEKHGHQEHHEGHTWTITWGSPPHIHHPFPIFSREYTFSRY